MPLDDEFKKLEKSGKTNVDDLVKWMKHAKIINDNFTEDQAQEMFKDMNQSKVELQQFKSVLETIATQQKLNIEDMHKSLLDESKKVLGTVKAGFSAFTKAFKKGDKQ